MSSDMEMKMQARYDAGNDMLRELDELYTAVVEARPIIAAAVVVLQFEGKDKSAHHLRGVLERLTDLTTKSVCGSSQSASGDSKAPGGTHD